MTVFDVGSVVGSIEGVGKQRFMSVWMDIEILRDVKIKSEVPLT